MNTELHEAMLPPITDANRGYWEGCAAGELRLQVCGNCRHHRFPDGPVCPRCLSGSASWEPVSGRGTLWSWIRMHQRYFPAFADEIPYLVGFVRLEEGPFMMSGLVDPPTELRVDMPLEAVFVAVGSERVIPRFRVVAP